MEKKISSAKKPTRNDLERRIKSAIVLVPKDKETQNVSFDDKGVSITVTSDYAVVDTISHQHVFHYLTSTDVSRPYIYLKQFVQIATENDCFVKDEDGNQKRSYAKLFEVLKEKEDTTEYTIAWYCDKWMFNIFAPLYMIDNSEVASFLVYEQYIHNIARNMHLLDEHKEDVTNVQFFNKICETEREFFDETDERVILKAKTDDERLKETLDALQEQELESSFNELQDIEQENV